MYVANQGAFRKLSRLRLSEANLLLANGHYAGAFYLAGYSVECALKAKIAIILHSYDIPDPSVVKSVYTHNLPELMKLAALKDAFDKSSAKNPQLTDNWNTIVGVDGWNEESRYNEIISKQQAEALVNAVESATGGILRWIEKN